MTITLYLLTLTLPLATVLIVFGMRYFAMAQQAKTRLAHDEAYRRLAEGVASAQSKIATSLSALELDLSEVRRRMSAVEAILEAVE